MVADSSVYTHAHTRTEKRKNSRAKPQIPALGRTHKPGRLIPRAVNSRWTNHDAREMQTQLRPHNPARNAHTPNRALQARSEPVTPLAKADDAELADDGEERKKMEEGMKEEKGARRWEASTNRSAPASAPEIRNLTSFPARSSDRAAFLRLLGPRRNRLLVTECRNTHIPLHDGSDSF